MPDNNELIETLRAVIQQEMQSVTQEIRSIVQEEIQPVNERLDRLENSQNERIELLEQGQNERLDHFEQGQQEIGKDVKYLQKDVTTIKKEVRAAWDDIKRLDDRLSVQEKKAIR